MFYCYTENCWVLFFYTGEYSAVLNTVLQLEKCTAEYEI